MSTGSHTFTISRRRQWIFPLMIYIMGLRISPLFFRFIPFPLGIRNSQASCSTILVHNDSCHHRELGKLYIRPGANHRYGMRASKMYINLIVLSLLEIISYFYLTKSSTAESASLSGDPRHTLRLSISSTILLHTNRAMVAIARN